MVAPSYPTAGGNLNVIPEPDIEHQWIQGGQDDGRRSRKRKICFIWTAVICCTLVIPMIIAIIALIIVLSTYNFQ